MGETPIGDVTDTAFCVAVEWSAIMTSRLPCRPS
jgi:hypothetical protein